jgi:ribose 5-phosphate isomerase B
MKLVVGSDHAGVDLKRVVAEALRTDGHHVIDVGSDDAAVPVDYPDYAVAVA